MPSLQDEPHAQAGMEMELGLSMNNTVSDTRLVQLDELFRQAGEIVEELVSELDRKTPALNRAEWIQVRVTQAQMAASELKELL